MPRNMSFMLTTDQIRNRTKTVTRRLGWWFLKPGDILNACEKCQGLKKGEKIVKICQIRVVSTRQEELWFISRADVVKEGFPDQAPYEFVFMFTKEMKCEWDIPVNRIEFEYIEETTNNGL